MKLRLSGSSKLRRISSYLDTLDTRPIPRPGADQDHKKVTLISDLSERDLCNLLTNIRTRVDLPTQRSIDLPTNNHEHALR